MPVREQTLDFELGAAGSGLLGAQGGVTHEQRLADIIGQLLTATMSIALLLLFLYLVWGAMEWVTSAGDKAKIEAARNKMTQAAIGVIVLASVIAIFIVVQNFIGVEVFKFDFS